MKQCPACYRTYEDEVIDCDRGYVFPTEDPPLSSKKVAHCLCPNAPAVAAEGLRKLAISGISIM